MPRPERLAWVACLVVGLAHAHLGTPWKPVAEVLRSAPSVALVEVTGPATPAGVGVEQPVKRLLDLAAPTPPAFVIYQEGAHQHALAVGDRVLLPLTRTPAGGWRYGADTRAPLDVPRGQERPTAAFVRSLRAEAPLEPGPALDRGIALLGHPAPLARQVGVELLVALGAQAPVTPDRLDRLLDPLNDPAEPLDDRLQRLRVAEIIAGAAAADAVAARLPRLAGDRLRLAAAGLMARHPTPAGRRALAACADEAGAVGARCGRLLGSLPPAPGAGAAP